MNDQGLVNVERALTFEKLARHLPDSVCNAFEPFLPPVVWCGNGRPPISNRDCLHAAIFILISGTPWKLMPACFPSYKTVRKRLRRWVEQEAFRQLWSASACRYGLVRGINFDQLSIDGARKPSKKGGATTGPNPTDRAKDGVKRSLLCEGRGVPLGLAVDGANRNDFKLVEATLLSIPVERPEVRLYWQQNMCLDKGYDYDEVRDLLRDFSYTAHIRARGEEAKAIKRAAGFKARRWVVERTHSWMNRFRRILIRWEKKPENYFGLLHLVCAIITIRCAGLLG